MSLSTNVTDLATRVGTELKSHKTLINGNTADLSSLSTTAKQNLVAAINEVAASLATAAGIDDGSTATTSTWSSSKTASEIGAASTADRARDNHTGTQSADTLTDGTTNKAYTATERSKLAGVAAGATANATDASLRDFSLSTGQRDHTAISDFDAKLAELRDDILGGAGAAVDTLQELADLIANNQDLIASLEAVAANKVGFDVQSLTVEQQAQARTNIAAASTAGLSDLDGRVGDTNASYTAALDAALL